MSLLGALAGLTGCGPRLVSQITSGRDQRVKLAWNDGSENGLLTCELDEGGKLGGCKQLPIAFDE